MRRWAAWIGVFVAVAATGCGTVGSRPLPGDERVAASGAAQLLAYTSCTQFLAQVKTQALAEVGADGLPTPSGTFLPSLGVPEFAAATDSPSGVAEGADTAAPSNGAAGSTASAGAAPYSTSNDQEQGVDEPDLVKTDGQLLVALRESPIGLQVASVGTSPAAAPRLRGFLPLPASSGNPSGFFLAGNDAVVLAPGTSPVPRAGAPATPSASGPNNAGQTTEVVPAQAPATTDVTVVDVGDPDHPVVSHSFVVQGTEVDARLIDGYVELVVDSVPNLPFVAPANTSAAAYQQALASNRALVLDSTPTEWLPSVVSEPGGKTTSPDCSSTLHTVTASGLDTVSVVPIAPGSSRPLPAVTVMGDATTVYASTSSLYVATSPWSELEPDAPSASNGPVAPSPGSAAGTTVLHGFDLSDPAAPRYLGSGQVPGALIGQYALSEYRGYLRVASTVGQPSPAPGEGIAPAAPSDNRVTILQPEGGALATVATLGGLGSGEKIYAVRFIGPLGFVVTFRQTDPLYVVDLSNPANPHTAGQLALTGYSSFLQPVGNGLLLGIGRSVDPNLHVTGLQVSLFDVSDPADPTLVSKLTYAEGSSTAETDPHALLDWAPSDLAIMPLELPGGGPAAGPAPASSDVGSSGGPSSAPFDGAVALRVTSTGLAEAARLAQPAPITASPDGCPCARSQGLSSAGTQSTAVAPYSPSSGIERSVVVGNTLYTVSMRGIMANDLTSFAQVAWLPYTSTGS
jgi:hypothetical protein